MSLNKKVQFNPERVRESRKGKFEQRNVYTAEDNGNSTGEKKVPLQSPSWQRKPQPQKHDGVRCEYCNRTNHTIESCFEKLKRENKCFLCKKVGHSQDVCFHNPNRYTVKNPARLGKRNYDRTMQTPQGQGYNNKNNRNPNVDTYNRENFNRSSNSNSNEQQKLLHDIQQFYNTAKGDLSPPQ